MSDAATDGPAAPTPTGTPPPAPAKPDARPRGPRRIGAWVRARLRALGPERLLRIAAVLTLLALALMVWSMLQPTPLPVMLAMTVGQGIGTLAFGLYGYVVIADLRRARRARRASASGSFPGAGASGSLPAQGGDR